eukprot:61197_1
MYAKTTPLALHSDENTAANNNAYGSVNDVYYSNESYNNKIQMMANVLINQVQQQPQQYQMNEKKKNEQQFDFAMFDLRQQLELIKRELGELEKEIATVDAKTAECDAKLAEIKAEGERVSARVEREKKMMTGAEEDKEYSTVLAGEVEQLRTANMALSASSGCDARFFASAGEGVTRFIGYGGERERVQVSNLEAQHNLIIKVRSIVHINKYLLVCFF